MAGTGPRETAPDEIPEQEGFTEINIVPLVDIMLVLLVILMATSTAILEQQEGPGQGAGFRVNLPTGTESDELPGVDENLVVAVLDDGTVVARGEEVSEDELIKLFEAEAAKDSGRLVLVQADESALHKRVVQVMATARKAGLRNLAIATQPDEQ